jgi:hypothetical protein
MIEEIKDVARDVSAFTERHPLATYLAVRLLTPPPVQSAFMVIWVGSMIVKVVRNQEGRPE